MSKPILDPVFDIGRDLQRAYDEGYKQGRYDEKVETETSLPNGESTHGVRSDTISRSKAIDALKMACIVFPPTPAQKDMVEDCLELIKNLPSAQPETCEGCKHLDKWENEVEYGYPSPCTCCKRRVEDHYEI